MIKPRSYGACWTCRIRKVKCDETGGVCERCNSLRITCHGYGKKPAWMDGGQQEGEEVERIKLQIKETNKIKRVLRNSGNRSPSMPQGASFPHVAEVASSLLAPTHDRGSVANDPPGTTESTISLDDDKSEANATVTSSMPEFSPLSINHDFFGGNLARISQGSDKTPSPSLNPAELLCLKGGISVPTSLAEQDTTLLMHYMDSTFPQKFRFYKPHPSEGGRGWLLGLILGNRPLFHATLTLAAYHMQKETSIENFNEYRINILEDLESHHAMSLNGLRRHIDGLESTENTGDMSTQIAIFACMIQLVLFEVDRGGTSDWLTHLQGASALVQNLKSFLLPSQSSVTVNSSNPFVKHSWKEKLTKPSLLSPNTRIALEFFATAFVWLDALSCTTTGFKLSCPEWLFSSLHDENGRLQMCKLMGCKNWVISIIIEIAALECWKRECLLEGNLSMRQLAHQANCIEKRLNYGLATNAKAVSSYGNPNSDGRNLETRAVTNVFGCSALTYLHVVLSGPYPELPEIKESVHRTLGAFQALPQSQWARSLVWPFCISGSMALPQNQDAFRNIARGAILHGQLFGNFEVAGAIAEECWAIRHKGNDRVAGPCDWRTAMSSLGVSVLLI